MSLTVEQLLTKYGQELALTLFAGKNGVHRPIPIAELQRPGLALSGYTKGMGSRRIIVIGKAEMGFMKQLPKEIRRSRIDAIFGKNVPAVIIARNFLPPKECIEICERRQIPLLISPMKTMMLINRLTLLLNEEFSEKTSCHGTFVEAFGIGVLIQGDSSVGKSEAALGLIERGHRLICDDIVQVKKKEGGLLEGSGTELTKHLIEIRGIGIINVAHLYGAVCVSEKRHIDLIIRLEEWDDTHFYDRIGLEERYTDLLGVKVPSYILPVKPGRDVVLLIETTLLNHRLKEMGYNSAKEFNIKLLREIAKRQSEKKISRITSSH